MSSLSVVSAGADLRDQIGNLERLDAEQDDVSLLDYGTVVGRDLDAPLRGERRGAVGVGDGGEKLVRVQDLLFEEGLEENSAHLAGSEHGDT